MGCGGELMAILNSLLEFSCRLLTTQVAGNYFILSIEGPRPKAEELLKKSTEDHKRMAVAINKQYDRKRNGDQNRVW